MSGTGKILYALYAVGGLCCFAALIVLTDAWLQDRNLSNSVSLAMSPLAFGIASFLAADRLRFWETVLARAPARRGVGKVPPVRRS
jgi:hypothetical protein